MSHTLGHPKLSPTGDQCSPQPIHIYLQRLQRLGIYRLEVLNHRSVMGSQLELHHQTYIAHARCCSSKLEGIWDSIDLSLEERQVQVDRIQGSALGVWDGAVAEANQRRLMVVSQIESMQREASKIAEQLGHVHDAVCWRPLTASPERL